VDAAADAVARLDDRRRDAPRGQLAGRGEPGETRSDNHNIRFVSARVRHDCTLTSASLRWSVRMASSPRDAEREEERRLNLRTLTIASSASAVAAAVTSQLWIAGTWIAAALTPVLVTLISELLHRPTERVARAWTTDPGALGGRAAARAHEPLPGRAAPRPEHLSGEAGPMRVYRQSRGRPSRRKIAIGMVAATGALAFVIGIVMLTTVDLVSGGSVGKGSGRTTLLSDGNDGDRGDSGKDAAPDRRDKQDEAAPDQPSDKPSDQPSDQPDTSEPTPEQGQEAPPSDTAPAPPPSEPAPGEPLPDAVP
jgi:hypothetical protein